MKIYGVESIYDNGEFVTIVTNTGSAVHLPMNSTHSITIHTADFDGAWAIDYVSVDVHN